MARVIFVNRYFFPDHSATSQILSHLTFHLAAIGHEVHVTTSRQRYDDPHAALPENENINGVQVHRVLAAPRYPDARLTIFRFTDRCAAASARSPRRVTLW